MEALISWLILIILIAIVVLWVIPGIISALIVVVCAVGMFIYTAIVVGTDLNRGRKLRDRIKNEHKNFK